MLKCSWLFALLLSFSFFLKLPHHTGFDNSHQKSTDDLEFKIGTVWSAPVSARPSLLPNDKSEPSTQLLLLLERPNLSLSSTLRQRLLRNAKSALNGQSFNRDFQPRAPPLSSIFV